MKEQIKQLSNEDLRLVAIKAETEVRERIEKGIEVEETLKEMLIVIGDELWKRDYE